MSLLYHTHQKTDLKERDYDFILALVCMALAPRGCQRSFHASTRRRWNHQRNYVRRSLKTRRHEERFHPYCHS
jgi:hypothetical protein